MSKTEVLHLLISWLTISAAFSFIFGEVGLTALAYFPMMLVAVGTAFVLHELGHKYVAIAYGARAEYRAWTWGLIMAIGLAIVTNGNFVFAAPGAVYIMSRNLTRAQNGKIAFAGPMVNLILGILFLVAVFYVGIWVGFFFLLAQINLFLGFFNLLPIYPLDGAKVKAWSFNAWLTGFALCGGLLAVLYAI
ncbi:MAG: site-2 protease family protein [Candidatus Diapherotrites archaeon]|nr:site-2 protease family protein [Candidatus Diapherotrites archaeon]